MVSSVKGGDKLQAYLREQIKSLTEAKDLDVGFLAGATYPDGTPVAMVAAVQEFGAQIEQPEREQTLYFKQNARTGGVGNRFVKKDKSNFSQDVVIPAHTVTIPPRPFFRRAIDANAGQWPQLMAAALQNTGYHAQDALGQVGQAIADQIGESIDAFTDPPIKESTARKKGFDKPLVETGEMKRAVDYRVNK